MHSGVSCRLPKTINNLQPSGEQNKSSFYKHNGRNDQLSTGKSSLRENHDSTHIHVKRKLQVQITTNISWIPGRMFLSHTGQRNNTLLKIVVLLQKRISSLVNTHQIMLAATIKPITITPHKDSLPQTQFHCLPQHNRKMLGKLSSALMSYRITA